MKADAPEMRALLTLIGAWDPLVCVDLHVTDGADFQPDISLQAEPINQGDPQLYAAGRTLRDALIAQARGAGLAAPALLSGSRRDATIRLRAFC